jgi:hypothetical protein
MTAKPAERDERTVAIENASYRWAYLLLTFGLLIATAYRAFVWNQSSWDLLGLVIAGGVVTTFYQGTRRVLSQRWAMMSAAAAVLGVVLSAIIWLLRR